MKPKKLSTANHQDYPGSKLDQIIYLFLILMITLIFIFFSLLSSGPVSSPTCPKTSMTTMALSLEDFLSISQRQRKEEQELRAEERAADLKEINKMIENGVKDEVERVLVPIQAKNDERFSKLESAMSKMQEVLKDPPLPHPERMFPHQPPIQQLSPSLPSTMIPPSRYPVVAPA